MNKLFEIPKAEPKNPHTCRECEHRERWECNSKVISYCGIRSANNTHNGKLKIKANRPSCLGFKPKAQ